LNKSKAEDLGCKYSERNGETVGDVAIGEIAIQREEKLTAWDL